MGSESLIIIAAICVGLYMAWNIGANDVANSMGTSVGSKALTLRQAVIVASICNFAGAVLVGGNVTDTIKKGIIDITPFMSNPNLLMYGMFAALMAAGIWLQIATATGLPVSTTHSIVGAVIGFGLISGGTASVNWSKVIQIAVSWVVSPLMGGIISFAMFSFIKRKILYSRHPLKITKKVSPYLVFLVAVILVFSFIYKGLKNIQLDLPLSQSLIISIIVGIIAAFTSKHLIGRIDDSQREHHDELRMAEKVFSYLQVITAGFVAFAHGSNDVANSVGPLAAIISISKNHMVMTKVETPIWILMLGGVGIALGISTWGYKVIDTIGKKITEITPSRGFSAEFGAATTVLICSKLGLPISTTHTLVGSVIGVGLARGMIALNFNIIRNIISSWFITLPFTAILAIIIYKVLLIIT